MKLLNIIRRRTFWFFRSLPPKGPSLRARFFARTGACALLFGSILLVIVGFGVLAAMAGGLFGAGPAVSHLPVQPGEILYTASPTAVPDTS